jgi:hypothetical protein
MDRPDIGEKAISKAVEIGLSQQLDEAEELNVDIRTNPLDLVQGKLQSVEVQGKGLVMQEDLRAEQLTIQTDSIEIDSIKAAFGNIELTNPSNARSKIVLTAADIERAFNSKYVRKKMPELTIERDGKLLVSRIDRVRFTIPETEVVRIEADLIIADIDRKQTVVFTAIPRVNQNGNGVLLEDLKYPENETVNSQLTSTLLALASEILDLRNFDLKEMSLSLKQLEVKPEKIILIADAIIEKFPQGN